MILMRVESEELLRNHLEERSAHSMARHHRFTGRREGNCLAELSQLGSPDPVKCFEISRGY